MSINQAEQHKQLSHRMMYSSDLCMLINIRNDIYFIFIAAAL